ncbi:hypothetical protein K474DRAFT_1660939 [Panus rudis PR-1116 ss-1]|nr:hypothetical protein K474DRAFT_1668310 [Panus rudis PR-1116 ss-1]KAI0074518.1 hypothetical protein K474DRAFT_1665351 [Panus rudis PR-1116 ss-1]KAI0074713.1 hypothetical protein K474DRAFT_1665158 [Panus rudis PR-1116 ss-1]KAI0076122.1 hypothetical protein K474DRAFT_1663374 [Panus rudis PR-1116 ss-1]KAI0078049.1 hypothetical protein K474DRAFT_1660892 [Panus rudis PR-1116 ss-1]
MTLKCTHCVFWPCPGSWFWFWSRGSLFHQIQVEQEECCKSGVDSTLGLYCISARNTAKH